MLSEIQIVDSNEPKTYNWLFESIIEKLLRLFYFLEQEENHNLYIIKCYVP